MKQTPIHKIRIGAIQAAIWRNKTEKGTFHNVTVKRGYKDKDGEWKDTDSFGRDDLLVLAKVIDHAHSWICYKAKEKADDET